MKHKIFGLLIWRRWFADRSDFATGQAVLTTILFLLFISAALLFSFSSVALKETNISRIDVNGKQSYFLAEAGIEDLVWRIRNNKQYSSSQTITLGGSSATIDVETTGNQKTVRSQGSVSQAVRSVSTVLKAGAGASFVYGVQVGEGGLRMENSSTVNGSVYSNGDIWGGGSGVITGDAFVATTHEINDSPNIGGNAQAHRIRNVSVQKYATSTTALDASSVSLNAYANSFATSSSISGTCFYVSSISANTNCGTRVQVGIPATDLPAVPLPISDQQISDWESAAEAGGIHTSPCPYTLSSGTTVIGPKKINCDFTIQNTAVVIVTGPLWVVGNLDVKNSAKLQLASSYGSGSEVVIADNPSNRTSSSKVTVQNSASILGSGTSGSYLALISQNNSAELGGGEVAIQPKNSADASIYLAPHGRMLIENSTVLKEAAAYIIHMKNSSTLNYEQGLANVNFSSGPTGGWNIQNWNEVK